MASSSLIGGRSVNQDAFAWSEYGDPANDGYVVAAVADGLGSIPSSELIAEAAVDAAVTIGARLDHQDDPAHLIKLATVVVGLHERYADQRHIFDAFEHGDAFGRRPDTVLVVATATTAGEVHAGWIGDCRAYIRVVDGRLIQLTHDHNLGRFGHPHRLTRSLAHPDRGPETGRWYLSTDPAHQVLQVLLTSDGVHEVLPKRAIAYALATAPTPQRAVAWLTGWAVRAAGRHADNATALLLTLPATTAVGSA